jgi:putative MFS transporter
MFATHFGARLDSLPIGTFHRRVLAALAFAFFFELADLSSFAYAAPGLRRYGGLEVHDIAAINSAGFAGMFIGATTGGRVADRLGRKRTMVMAIVWYSVASVGNAAVSGVPGLLTMRLLTGVGLSALTVVAMTYLSETMPAALRGRMQSAVLAIGLLGIPAIAFAARAVVPLGPNGWRLVFLLGGAGLLDLLLVRTLPESPRWLLANRGERAALEALGQLEATNGRRRAGPEPEAVGGASRAMIPLDGFGTGGPHQATEAGAGPPLDSLAAAPTTARRAVRGLFAAHLGRRTVMLWTVWAFQTLGVFGFVAWVPTLLLERGLTLSSSLTFAAVTTLGAVPGALLAWPISDRFGRRPAIAVVSLLLAVFGVLFGLSASPVGIVIFGVLVAGLTQTFAALLYAYTPEQYPTAVRNTGSGLAYGVGRLVNIIGPILVAVIYATAGYAWVFGAIAGCWAVVSLAVTTLGQRTNHAALEVLSEVPQARLLASGDGRRAPVLPAPPAVEPPAVPARPAHERRAGGM